MEKMISVAIDENTGFAQQSNVDIQLLGGNEPITVMVDENRIQQVLDNLISNAIKYSPANETITISTSIDKNIVTVSVCDKGPGVAEQFQAQLFDKFTQGEASNTRKYSGSGLGLSISRAIIEQHGGKIYYLSPASGGSCFCFELKADARVL